MPFYHSEWRVLHQRLAPHLPPERQHIYRMLLLSQLQHPPQSIRIKRPQPDHAQSERRRLQTYILPRMARFDMYQPASQIFELPRGAPIIRRQHDRSGCVPHAHIHTGFDQVLPKVALPQTSNVMIVSIVFEEAGRQRAHASRDQVGAQRIQRTRRRRRPQSSEARDSLRRP